MNRKTVYSIPVILILSLVFIRPGYSFVRYVSLNSTFVKWFITNPSDVQNRPLVDVSGDGSLYAVQYTLAAAGSDDFPNDQSELDALRAAFQAYSQLPGSSLQFVENETLVTGPQIANDGINTIFWDEDGSTVNGGNIPDDQLALAIISFDGATGELQDVDIRFNGQDYTWVTEGADGTTTIDIYSVALHQIGLMAGLDSSLIDSTSHGSDPLQPAMFPLIAGERMRTGLSQDDRSAIAHIYPNSQYPSLFGSISGTVFQTNGSFPIYGCQVIAIDAETGAPVVSALTGSGALGDDANANLVQANSGKYTLHGLPPGDYFVAIQPLKGGQVDESSLQSAYPLLGDFNTDIIAEFYNVNDTSLDRTDAKTPVTVTAGTNAGGINIIANSINQLLLTDNSSVVYNLTDFSFLFYGQSYDRFYIHSDGFITFGQAQTGGSETPSGFFSGPPRIAALWDDLNPSALGANVSVVEKANQVDVIYALVPESPSQGLNTFAVSLFSDGTIAITYNLISTTDDGIVGLSPGGGIQNAEVDFSSISNTFVFQEVLPIYEQFVGSGDDANDPGSGDPFDLDAAKLTFAPNAQGSYNLVFETNVDATPTPTPSNTSPPTVTPTPTAVGVVPTVSIEPTSANLTLGATAVITVTATDPDSANLTFTDVPKGSGTFGTVVHSDNGIFTTTYTVEGTFDQAGQNTITILASDGSTSGLAIFDLFVDVPPTPTPTNTIPITPSPTPTPLPPNATPVLSVSPSKLSLIVGESKTISITVNDANRDSIELSASPSNVGEFKNVSAINTYTLADFVFTAKAGQEGALVVTIRASDGQATVSKTVLVTIFAEGTKPTSTPTPTRTPTITNTPTITPTFTITPTPTPTMDQPPVITIDPMEATISDGESVIVSVESRDPNLDRITFNLDDPKHILENQSFTSSGSRIQATYLFDSKISSQGINHATFTATDGKNTTTAVFTGIVALLATPTPTPIPQGDMVVAQGEGGNSFVHRRQVPGVTIAPGSAFNAMPARFAEAIVSPATREVYVSTGDVDGDGQADIVTTFGPYNPFFNAFPNVLLVRDAATRRVIGHSFQAFPHTSSAGVNNPYGEVRTAVGHFIPNRNSNQIVTAHGVGGKNVIRIWEYTGQPAPNGFQVLTQFEGLVSTAGTSNQSGALSIAAGDLTGDGIDELVVGQTNSQTSQTIIQAIYIDANYRLFRSKTYAAFPIQFRGKGGVNLAVGDIDGDGSNEIVAASMGNPDGSLVNGNVFKNLVSLLRPVTQTVFGVTLVDTFESIPNGIFNVFSNDENPSGAVTVSVGDLVPGGGDEAVFGTSSVLTYYPGDGATVAEYPAPQAMARAVQLQFNADGRYAGLQSVIANRTGKFRPFVMDNPNYSGAVNISIRRVNN